MIDKPTLPEIAAMPFPASMYAMQKHYVPDWGKPIPEGIKAKRKFSVTVDYEASYTDHETVEVEAWSEEEAEELAAEMVCKEVEGHITAPFPDIEVNGTSAKLVGEAHQ